MATHACWNRYDFKLSGYTPTEVTRSISSVAETGCVAASSKLADAAIQSSGYAHTFKPRCCLARARRELGQSARPPHRRRPAPVGMLTALVGFSQHQASMEAASSAPAARAAAGGHCTRAWGGTASDSRRGRELRDMATSTISIALLALGSAAATGAEDAAARGGPVHDGGHWGGEGLPRRGPAHAVPHRLREADASAARLAPQPCLSVRLLHS